MIHGGAACARESLDRFPLLAGLEGEHLPALECLEAEPGAVLARQGEPVERVLFLVEGQVEAEARAPGDREVTLCLATAGASLGELALNGPHRHPATLTAATAIRAYSLPVGTFRASKAALHPVALQVLRRLAVHLGQRLQEEDPDLQVLGAGAQAEAPPETSPSAAPEQHLGLLRALPFFRAFADAEIRELLGRLRERRFLRGSPVFVEGTEGSSCFLVARGAVQISAGGRRLAILGPGRMFGEIALLTGGPRTASCTARENTVLLEVPGREFDELYHRQSPLALKFLEALNEELIASLQRLDARRVGLATMGCLLVPRRPDLETDQEALVARITRCEVGEDLLFPGCGGGRRRILLDLAAPARPLSFLEDFLRSEVTPLASDPVQGERTSGRLVEEARALAAEAFGAGPADRVTFVFEPLQDVVPGPLVEPTVHDEWGRVDPAGLAPLLSPGMRVRIPACSPSTGAVQDLEALARVLRAAGARAVWDLGSAFAHLEVAWPRDVTDAVLAPLDRLVGGDPAPAVLVSRWPAPERLGGLSGVQSVARGGLALSLHRSVGASWIAAREAALARRARQRWAGLHLAPEPPPPALPLVGLRLPGSPERCAAALRALFGLHLGVAGGWLQVGFPYFLSNAGLEYVLEAIALAAAHPRRLLEAEAAEDLGVSLRDLEFRGGGLALRAVRACLPETALREHLREARAWLESS